MSEWKQYKLEDLVSKFIDYRGKTPSKTLYGIPLITAKIVKSGRLLEPNEFIAEIDYEKWMTRGFPEINDIILTTEAPLGEVALVKDKNVALAQRIITLQTRKDICNSIFLKYYLQSNEGQSVLHSRASGSTVEGIKAAELKKVEISIPSLPEQKAIASILSSLDDKIDLLHSQNATLEKMAETLFRKWFVEEAKEDWEKGTVLDLFKLQRGFDLPTQHRIEGQYKILTSSGVNGTHNEYKVKGPGITTGRSGVIGNVYYINEDFWPLNTSLFVIEFKRATPLFTYHFLRMLDLPALNAGSAVPTLNRNDVHLLETELPPRWLIVKYDKIVIPFFEKINSNQTQIRTLTTLRDNLLPKLMSGEVKVQVKG